jgi:hypothetical protein
MGGQIAYDDSVVLPGNRDDAFIFYVPAESLDCLCDVEGAFAPTNEHRSGGTRIIVSDQEDKAQGVTIPEPMEGIK